MKPTWFPAMSIHWQPERRQSPVTLRASFEAMRMALCTVATEQYGPLFAPVGRAWVTLKKVKPYTQETYKTSESKGLACLKLSPVSLYPQPL